MILIRIIRRRSRIRGFMQKSICIVLLPLFLILILGVCSLSYCNSDIRDSVLFKFGSTVDSVFDPQIAEASNVCENVTGIEHSDKQWRANDQNVGATLNEDPFMGLEVMPVETA
ncbi:hypothetical protein RchiOBHm_Chr7g0229561 [Rosa chinensis]|uniref:Uncharacterized protein n=1 Tax=Rosa chinensis TaxID=74649 RepID=A0A2P6PF62_ROSCH|nr:hypothetical protein RchiOBHm_Chr7g0229561 [Rosa chinensis]